MTLSRLPTASGDERPRSSRLQAARVQGLSEEERQRTAEAFFDEFSWEPSSVDPRRLTAEAFLRKL